MGHNRDNFRLVYEKSNQKEKLLTASNLCLNIFQLHSVHLLHIPLYFLQICPPSRTDYKLYNHPTQFLWDGKLWEDVFHKLPKSSFLDKKHSKIFHKLHHH